MTVDKKELKALAEAATTGPWCQHGGISQVFGRDCETVCETYEDEGDCSDARFIAAASPATILSLLGEIERISARLCMCRDCQGQGEVHSGRSSYEGYNQPPEPIIDVCGTCGGDGVLGPVQDFESLAAERDQFKAAHLEWIEKTEWVQKSVKAPELGKHRADVINQRFEQLKTENEALRKDAERLDRLDKEGSGYGAHELEGYAWTVDGPFSSVRDAIDCLFDYDDAMAKEQSHG
ncbi:ead/Ea22-like family protein [Pseudomonas cichorii]|uniref:ead/Ea22-like family protein n=1 Tax=Pseudomonas cichorii TaxID=36746 RepID=UPI001C8A53A4|nr:ead/Ea22-like family protein [Pseudomonas cichorii]MBX8528536.1 ead/Ea22-like family protein [Pseudomonas cichorii]